MVAIRPQLAPVVYAHLMEFALKERMGKDAKARWTAPTAGSAATAKGDCLSNVFDASTSTCAPAALSTAPGKKCLTGADCASTNCDAQSSTVITDGTTATTTSFRCNLAPAGVDCGNNAQCLSGYCQYGLKANGKGFLVYDTSGSDKLCRDPKPNGQTCSVNANTGTGTSQDCASTYCANNACAALPPTAKSKVRRNMPQLACAAQGKKYCSGSDGVKYECLDVMTSLESCGGCDEKDGAVDCSELPHVAEVECRQGLCRIGSCMPGWVLRANACDVDSELGARSP
ncbi:hypothetical protein MNV49_001223 [Pseudohyphozyma bogoriensis]|nr:hypothetical protein MNV49_001223 [Pseudohyphozyma bogoriensis]